MTQLDNLVGINLEDETELIREARKGISPRIFVRFAKKIGIPETTLGKLINISSKTIHNYIVDGRRLRPVQSEHLLKLILVYRKGIIILGTLEDFIKWLQCSSDIGHESFIHLFNTPGGIDIVSEELTRIAGGYPV
jgi:putative toxin-antitoxin system antitoxin component (TIGR02293 family)